MQLKISDPASIGQIVRACRKSQKVRQDDAADSIGVSENFLGKVEKGSDSVNWGKLFQVLRGMGIHVILDVPEEAGRALSAELTARKQP
ncbi:MAG TPA: helix-turn-helix domain-containing protein [Limnobacter sp.]|nr:helix-turn-helix domain-containing protein [Limnobacter sp.]